MIIHSHDPIVLVGAGNVSAGDMDLVRTHGSKVVAVDGGASHCIAAGIMPDAVVGDLDSADKSVLRAIPAERIHRIDEQETTDFDKGLRSVDAPVILAVGFAGPRLDHFLAVCNTLARHSGKRAVVMGPEDIVFHTPARFALDLSPGERVSLFPMVPVTGRSRGLRWPIDGIAFDGLGRVGTSNEATGRVELDFDGPGMLVLMRREALAAVMRALSG